jgi:hypothetical protein
MNNLMDIANSEYNNASELFGILGGMDDEMLNNAFAGLGAADRIKFMQKVAKPSHSRGSRAEFEKFFREVPEAVRKALQHGDLRLADYTIYSIKQTASKTIKMFETQDNKEVGLRNIANAKLPKNFVFLVSGIYLLAGVAADADDKNKIMATDFKSIKEYPAIANAEFSFKANKKQIVPEGMILRKFITDNNHNMQLGYFKLDNPRLIKDDELIEFIIELGTMEGLDPKTFVYVGLDGTGTTP